LKKEQEEKEHKKKEKAEAHLYTIIKVLSSWPCLLKSAIEYCLSCTLPWFWIKP